MNLGLTVHMQFMHYEMQYTTISTLVFLAVNCINDFT